MNFWAIYFVHSIIPSKSFLKSHHQNSFFEKETEKNSTYLLFKQNLAQSKFISTFTNNFLSFLFQLFVILNLFTPTEANFEDWFGVNERLSSSSRYIKFPDAATSLTFCLREYEEHTVHYIPNFHRYRIKPGKVVYLSQYYYGRLLLGDEDLFEDLNQFLAIKNIKNETILEFEVGWNHYLNSLSLDKLMTMTSTSPSNSNNKNIFQKRLNQILETIHNSSETILEKFPTNLTILAFPNVNANFHYFNSIELSEESSSYSTFLSTLTNTQPVVPSIFNSLAKHWSILTSRKVEIYTAFAVYINRFTVHLLNNPKTSTSIESNNLNEGFISDIIYGNVFRVELILEIEANKLETIHEFFNYLYEFSFQLMEWNETEKGLPSSFQLEFNFTIFGEDKFPLNFKNFTLLSLFQYFKKLVSEIQSRSLKTAIPIAVQVKAPFHLDSPISFSFSQFVTSQLPPVTFLLLISNILITGSLLALIIASTIFVMISVLFFGAILVKLQEQGRIVIPPFLQVIPLRIYFITFRLPEIFGGNQHQHQE